MPLPLIPVALGAISLGSALFGAKKGFDAYKDMKVTKKMQDDAQKIYTRSRNGLEQAQKNADRCFQELGELQCKIVEGSFKEYAELIDALKIENTLDFQRAFGENAFDSLKTTLDSIVSLESVVGGIVGGVSAGAAAGFGAFGGAGLLASASTGTAISSLSGVAATNATLAWFGGGSLATGGLGMAGGTIVLGGLVAGPALAVAGYVFASSMEDKKYDAKSYLDSIEVLCEGINAERLEWQALANQAIEKRKILEDWDTDLNEKVKEIWKIVAKNGNEVSLWSCENQTTLQATMQIASAMIEVINAPLMNDEDELTRRLKEHQEKTAKLIDEINKKWK